MKLATLLTAAALVAAPLSAFADGFTFTDDRCRSAASGIICIARAEDSTVLELIGNVVDYDTFVALNAAVLPEDVSENTVIPALTVYMARM